MQYFTQTSSPFKFACPPRHLLQYVQISAKYRNVVSSQKVQPSVSPPLLQQIIRCCCCYYYFKFLLVNIIGEQILCSQGIWTPKVFYFCSLGLHMIILDGMVQNSFSVYNTLNQKGEEHSPGMLIWYLKFQIQSISLGLNDNNQGS